MNINFFIAFTAGVLSIFSPCIFPIIPSYFAYISGIEVDNFKTHRRKILTHAVMFSLGFSIVFIILGATLGTLGELLQEYKRTIEIIGGSIIILFALQILGVFRKLNILNFLSSSAHIQLKQIKKISPLKSLLTGVIFSFGWSPCYGPIMGAIITLSISEASFTHGLLLFSVYSLGMGLSFIVLALLAGKLTLFIKKTSKLRIYLNLFFALILLVLAISMITGGIGDLANAVNNLYTKLGINGLF